MIFGKKYIVIVSDSRKGGKDHKTVVVARNEKKAVDKAIQKVSDKLNVVKYHLGIKKIVKK